MECGLTPLKATNLILKQKDGINNRFIFISISLILYCEHFLTATITYVTITTDVMVVSKLSMVVFHETVIVIYRINKK